MYNGKKVFEGSDPKPVETEARRTPDMHGLVAAHWDKFAKAGNQGGARAACRHALEPVQFKSAGPTGAQLLKK